MGKHTVTIRYSSTSLNKDKGTNNLIGIVNRLADKDSAEYDIYRL